MNAVDIEGVTKTYRAAGHPPLLAVDNVTWQVATGSITGLVGESGSGKTTLMRCIMGLEKIDAGRVLSNGTILQPSGRSPRSRMRRQMQLVFQDPTASLNPRMTVGQLVSEGIQVHHLRPKGQPTRDRAAELLRLVGLDPRDLGRYPRSFSGGQRQRIAIARALAVEPEILICDEPVSALDVSVQAQILNLLADMQQRLGLTILLVAHDLAVIKQICSEIAVIQHGRIVEQGPAGDVLHHPQASYTKSLVSAVPVPDPVVARARNRSRRTERGLPTGPAPVPVADRERHLIR
jgi:ABC-type glutathione transport system ATPase component